MRKKKFHRALTIYLEPDKFSKVEQITNATDISIGAWFRSILDEKLAKQQQEPPAAADARSLKKKDKDKS